MSKQTAKTATKKRNKFGAIKTTVDGFRFDSKIEAMRYIELKARQAQGAILNLDRQISRNVVWPGTTVRDGKLFAYISDFEYDLPDGTHVVEDVKGRTTGPSYTSFRTKARAMRIVYDIDVLVVTRKAVRGKLRWHVNGVQEEKEYRGYEETG